MSSRPSTVTGTQRTLNKCLLKAGVLNARGMGKRKRRKGQVGGKKQERKGRGQKNKKIINIL